MTRKTVKRSVAMTKDMHDRLTQLVSKQQDVTEAELIRQAIRHYLDEQETVIGSRRHFQKSLRHYIDQFEDALVFHLTVLIFLVAADEQEIEQAILRTLRDGETLRAKIRAVYDLATDDQ